MLRATLQYGPSCPAFTNAAHRVILELSGDDRVQVPGLRSLPRGVRTWSNATHESWIQERLPRLVAPLLLSALTLATTICAAFRPPFLLPYVIVAIICTAIAAIGLFGIPLQVRRYKMFVLESITFTFDSLLTVANVMLLAAIRWPLP